MIKPLVSIFFLGFILSSCSQKSGVSSGTEIAGDSGKYIKIADAEKFLDSWSKENVLVFQTISDPDNLHPTNGTSLQRTEVNTYTQMFLINPGFRNLDLEPGVVKSLPKVSADGLQYFYELKDEPKWDDGKQLSVDDIIFTVKANKCPLTFNPPAKPYWENIKDIKPDHSNNRMFTVLVKHPYIQNVSLWTDFPIMERNFYDPKNILSNYSFDQFDDQKFEADKQNDLAAWAKNFNDEKFGNDPNSMNGLGMYKVESWDHGNSISLVKKKNHWTAGTDYYQYAAYPEKIIFKIQKDPNTLLLDFKAQHLDASTTLNTNTLTSLMEDIEFNRNYNFRFTSTYSYPYIAMNTRPDGVNHKKIFDDVRVRKAMAYLTPVDYFIKTLGKGRNKRITGPVSPLKKEYNDTLKLIPFDPEIAKKILDDAGWKDTDGDNIRDKIVDGEKIPLEFSINYLTTNIDWKDMATKLSEEMYKAGVKVNLNPLDAKLLMKNGATHDFDMMIGSFGGGSAPEDYTQLWHTSSWTGGGSNYAGFGNAESDALIDSIKFSIDYSVRIPLVKKLQQMIYNDHPYIYLYASLRRVVVHKRFGNLEIYFDRPGILLNTLRSLGGGMVKNNVSN